MLKRKREQIHREAVALPKGDMDLLRIFRPRVLLALGFGAIVAVTVSGFAAANTVPASKAGDGAGAITGYVVTAASVDYTLNAADPRNIDQVVFDLDSNPVASSQIRIKLVSGGVTWYSCTWVAGPPVRATCATTAPAAPVLAADELRVVIAD